MNNDLITDKIIDLMYKYDWMPASIAQFAIEHGIDIEYYAERA